MAEGAVFSSAKEIFEWMEHGCSQGIHPGLDRTKWLCKRLNHPERRLKMIHIAGTNGKGSTGAMIASVLQKAGYPTGMFTSPFIMNWNERITMDGQPIPEESFVRWANELIPLVEEMDQEGRGRVTPFEFWTLVAILYFAKEAFPWFVVWETGLGGRLDSTNVVYPLVSVITNIGHDHTHILGGEISQIAREKAGIIKPGVPVVTACEDDEALNVICSTAERKKSRLYRFGHDFDATCLSEGEDGVVFSFQNRFRVLEKVSVPLRGFHQVKNGATALMTLDVLRQYYAAVFEETDLIAGMEEVTWPGRLEKIADRPKVLLDGAHNQESAEALARALQHFQYDRLHLLVNVLNDKDAKAILNPLLPLADSIMVTGIDDPRGMHPEQLCKVAGKLQPDLVIQQTLQPEQGLKKLINEAGENDCILVTGTLYLISDIRKKWCSQ
ncbi:bifunctional folylpolyglutamate synthase/dihydrofolate synthase [Melghirimyces algeriensis]|uniref:tetrahydrofolate synthase n=1 Tax=Melghirimyces algeriensis TaxID=910412 RepID=A0A521ARM2_9BACL|nr:folylpolyglutamate synthase/dihydrofolate synthase family protein [Melghirimyces algeriensis]SMO37300.1 dihydrofolate synthase / folylpolyglutamate synthase [Melghirimyces algeriensis]